MIVMIKGNYEGTHEYSQKKANHSMNILDTFRKYQKLISMFHKLMYSVTLCSLSTPGIAHTPGQQV